MGEHVSELGEVQGSGDEAKERMSEQTDIDIVTQGEMGCSGFNGTVKTHMLNTTYLVDALTQKPSNSMASPLRKALCIHLPAAVIAFHEEKPFHFS